MRTICPAFLLSVLRQRFAVCSQRLHSPCRVGLRKKRPIRAVKRHDVLLVGPSTRLFQLLAQSVLVQGQKSLPGNIAQTCFITTMLPTPGWSTAILCDQRNHCTACVQFMQQTCSGMMEWAVVATKCGRPSLCKLVVAHRHRTCIGKQEYM